MNGFNIKQYCFKGKMKSKSIFLYSYTKVSILAITISFGFSFSSFAQVLEASVLHKYVFLKWKWPADQQPDHFEIERRNRGGSFGMIAMSFSAEANDTSALYYKDKLTGVEDHYYYRIKAVYSDGHHTYSEISSVSFEKSSDDKMIDATLDAASGKVKLALPSMEGMYICRIYNMNGVLLSVEKPFACAPELSLAQIEGKRFFIESYHPQTGKKFYSTFSRN
jgi:hypothetical protein